jgi:hypothetical protein
MGVQSPIGLLFGMIVSSMASRRGSPRAKVNASLPRSHDFHSTFRRTRGLRWPSAGSPLRVIISGGSPRRISERVRRSEFVDIVPCFHRLVAVAIDHPYGSPPVK